VKNLVYQYFWIKSVSNSPVIVEETKQFPKSPKRNKHINDQNGYSPEIQPMFSMSR